VQARTGQTLMIPPRTASFGIRFEQTGTEKVVMCILDTAPAPATTGVRLASGPLKPVKAKSFAEITEIYRKRGSRINQAIARSRVVK
jgi:hypothetical protein